MRKYKYRVRMKMFVQNDISFQIEKRSTLQKGVEDHYIQLFSGDIFSTFMLKIISQRCLSQLFNM